jgi:nucleotide-binding universal stress UspA family protein
LSAAAAQRHQGFSAGRISRPHDGRAGTRAEAASVETILIGVDGSTGSDGAVEHGLELAATMGAAALFVFVRQPPVPILDSPYYQRCVTGELEHAEDALARAHDRAREYGVPAQRVILEGNAAHEIVQLARIREVDLIVVGTRGLAAVDDSVVGSVSRTVVHAADRPVLVVPHAAAVPRPHLVGAA